MAEPDRPWRASPARRSRKATAREPPPTPRTVSDAFSILLAGQQRQLDDETMIRLHRRALSGRIIALLAKLHLVLAGGDFGRVRRASDDVTVEKYLGAHRLRDELQVAGSGARRRAPPESQQQHGGERHTR